MGKLLWSYLRDRRRILAGAVFLCVPLGGVLWLYGLALPQIAYALLATGLLGALLFGLPDFAHYRQNVLLLEVIRRNAEHLPEPVEPDGPLSQRLLMETVERQRQQVVLLESQENQRQQELMEYYTMWVHQAKTPLAAMRLILQSVEERPENAALQQELFKLERYLDMVLGYLRLYSMSADLRLELRPVRPIAARAVKKFAGQFIYKKLSLDLEEFDNQVVTDEKWLLFVLEQLISNAVKYTSSGGIRISMDGADVLTVSDTGVGIDPADLPRVCERGFTGRNGREEVTSTGLGLYLTKEILDKLQTRMEIESEPGKGTKVKLYLARPTLGKD